MAFIEFEAEHARVLDRALAIFVGKSKLRGQMWLEWPPSDKIRELRERVGRLEHAYKNRGEAIIEEAMIEDALDIINYAAFFVKQLERGQSG